MNQTEVENAGFQNKVGYIPHLINKRMIRFKFVHSFNFYVSKHLINVLIQAELGVVFRNISESILTQYGSFLNQVTYDFSVAFFGSQMKRRSLVCVLRIHIEILILNLLLVARCRTLFFLNLPYIPICIALSLHGRHLLLLYTINSTFYTVFRFTKKFLTFLINSN